MLFFPILSIFNRILIAAPTSAITFLWYDTQMIHFPSLCWWPGQCLPNAPEWGVGDSEVGGGCTLARKNPSSTKHERFIQNRQFLCPPPNHKSDPLLPYEPITGEELRGYEASQRLPHPWPFKPPDWRRSRASGGRKVNGWGKCCWLAPHPSTTLDLL